MVSAPRSPSPNRHQAPGRNDLTAVVELYRHFSNLRFIILPLFLSTLGAVSFAYWTLIDAGATRDLLIAITAAGTLLCLPFMVYEWRLNQALDLLYGELPWFTTDTGGNWLARNLVLLSTEAVFTAASGFFLYLLFRQLTDS